MSNADATAATETQNQVQTVEDALNSLVGKVVLVSTPDSLQAVPMGYQVKASCYKAKILKVFESMAVLAAEGSKKKGEDKVETLRQFVPLSSVKRICVGKGEVHLHL